MGWTRRLLSRAPCRRRGPARCWLRAVAALALFPGVLLLPTSNAWARAEAEVAYTREQAFSAALRYLRVDLAYEVTEKDADAAYLLFSFAAPELQRKQARGSIEVIQRERTVRISIHLPELPTYREEVLKQGLLEKLRTEYGEPPREAPRDEPSPKKPADEAKPPQTAPEENADGA